MSDLTGKFTELETQINDDADEAHSQRVTIISTLEDIQSAISSINSDLLLMKQSLLGAMGQTGACFPCPTPSIVVPTTNPDAVSIDPDKCKRAQAFIATMHAIFSAMDTLQSFNVVGSYNVINDAVGQVIGAVAAGDTLPLPSFPEGVNIVGDYVSYAGERLFSGVGILEQFTPLESQLRDAIYLSGSASGAQSAYNAIIDGSDASNAAKLLFKATAYNALWSYFFDPDSTPDLSPYAGDACGGGIHDITVCTDFASQETVTGGDTIWALQTPVLAPELGPTAIAGDFNGWSFQNIAGNPAQSARIYRWDGSGFHFVIDINPGGAAHTIDVATTAISCQGIDALPTGEQFVIRVCPPSE